MTNTELMEKQGTTHEEALARLEDKVTWAVKAVANLRAERDELRALLNDKENRIRVLEEEGEGIDRVRREAERWDEERARLFQERATTVRRVEAILQRLEGLGLD